MFYYLSTFVVNKCIIYIVAVRLAYCCTWPMIYTTTTVTTRYCAPLSICRRPRQYIERERVCLSCHWLVMSGARLPRKHFLGVNYLVVVYAHNARAGGHYRLYIAYRRRRSQSRTPIRPRLLSASWPTRRMRRRLENSRAQPDVEFDLPSSTRHQTATNNIEQYCTIYAKSRRCRPTAYKPMRWWARYHR